MNKGDFYTHYKGGEYFFDSIALPLTTQRNLTNVGEARYHDNSHDLELYIDDNGTIFINSDLPHVIYQGEDHYDTDFVWAREVDDFFGYKHITGSHHIKRFSLKG